MTNDFPGRDEVLNQELQQLIEKAKLLNRELQQLIEEAKLLKQELQQLTEEAERYGLDSENPQEELAKKRIEEKLAKKRIEEKLTEKRTALSKLVSTIQKSGRLNKQLQWSGIPNYKDYYNEALQQTFIEICQNISQYNSEYPVMVWVNTILKRRFSDVFEKDRKRGIKWLTKNSEAAQVLSLDELNKDVPLEHEVSEQEQLKEIVEADPEIFLINEHIKAKPEANLKVILLLVLEGKQWKEIAEELGVPLSTASSFYQRRMPEIISYLKKYLED